MILKKENHLKNGDRKPFQTTGRIPEKPESRENKIINFCLLKGADVKLKFNLINKLFLKITIMGLMFITASVGFAQETKTYTKWNVKYSTDDFGDRNGHCSITTKTELDESGNQSKVEIMIFKGFVMFVVHMEKAKDEITDRNAYFSFKTSDNRTIEAETGTYSSDIKIAMLPMSSEIITLFKNSSKLKVAVRILDYRPRIFELDCIGFTKVYNELLKCTDFP
jgi:hypothetical protein